MQLSYPTIHGLCPHEVPSCHTRPHFNGLGQFGFHDDGGLRQDRSGRTLGSRSRHMEGSSAVPLACWWVRKISWKVNAKRLLTTRIVVGFAAMTCFFTAAHGLAVADMSLIGRLQPLLIALLAPLFLGSAEQSDRRLWGLMALGFFGCAVLLGPGLAVGNLYGLWALAAIGFSTLAHITLRALGPHDDPRVVVFFFQTGVTILAFLDDIYTKWTSAHHARFAPLASTFGVGILATTGQLWMTQAYALASAARVSAASHTSPVWAILIDIVLFSLWPTSEMVLGGVIVMVAVLGLTKVDHSSKPPKIHEDAPNPSTVATESHHSSLQHKH